MLSHARLICYATLLAALPAASVRPVSAQPASTPPGSLPPTSTQAATPGAGAAASNKDLSVGGALRRSADRNGLWASLGLGRGSAGLHCAACADGSTYAYTLQGSVGMRISPRLLVGAETFAWMDVVSGDVDRIARGSYVIARAYTAPRGRLFLQGGLGLAGFQLKDDGVTFATRSPSGALTAGYDWRLDGFTITPSLTAVGSTGGRLNSDKTGNAIAERARLGVLRSTVSLSWYR